VNISKIKPMAIGAIVDVIAKEVSADKIRLGLKVSISHILFDENIIRKYCTNVASDSRDSNTHH
jgi:hypothetical protein